MTEGNATGLRSNRRRGSAYVLVVGAAMVAATLAVGSMLAGRAHARAATARDEMSTVTLAAQSGMDLARLWISQDTNWRTNRTSGTWASNLAIGNATVTIEVIDIVDGILANRPHDAVRVTSTATRGSSRHAITLVLQAQPTPLPVLAYPVSTAGPLRVRAPRTLTLGDRTLFTSSSLRNDQTIEGNVEVQSVITTGLIYGSVVTGATAKQTPGASIAETYAALGTAITIPNPCDRLVLGPGYNPYGAANAEGIYVIRPSSNQTIRNSRIIGTLVFISPGRRLLFQNSVLIQPSRSDYPALIVDGDLDVNSTSDTALSEAAQGTNFNPSGAPYLGGIDSDMTDTYPSEIQGLVHTTGLIKFGGKYIIRGALVNTSTGGGSDAVEFDANTAIYYDPTLFISPPQHYTTKVLMVPQSSSWKQKTD